MTGLSCYVLTLSCRIQEAGKIPRESVSMNRDLVREHRFKMSDLDGMLARKVAHIPCLGSSRANILS